MGDSEVFGKLSRIFETNSFAANDNDLAEILEDFDPTIFNFDHINNNHNDSSLNTSNKYITSPHRTSSDKPTPYEVWKEKNKEKFVTRKQTTKLNSQQWDKLVDKMHHSNKLKQSALIKEQNDELAHELDSFSFKPRINQTSLDLSATMKSLNARMPELMADRAKLLESKRKERSLQDNAECTFTPTRKGSKLSDMYLRKMGRAETVKPEDLFRYNTEKELRNQARKQIVDEIEERELTFKPQLGEKSIKLHEKLLSKGVIDIDPITRNTLQAPPTPYAGGTLGGLILPSTPGTNTRRRPTEHDNDRDSLLYEQGPVLQIESEHPYRHNMNEYTTVSIPGAISYSIKFHENTRTEAIYDYIKFYDDDTHTEYFGAGKYSGGTHGSSCNWPGVGSRPALIIPACRFIIHFKTNGSINDWGFCMQITPTLSNSLRQYQLENSNIPKITESGSSYRSPTKLGNNGTKSVPVYERLYQDALDKKTEFHNNQIDLLQTKLNIQLKPWENIRSSTENTNNFIKLNNSTHLPKYTISNVKESMLLTGNNNPMDLSDEVQSVNSSMNATSIATTAGKKYVLVEYDESMCNLWKILRT